MLSWNLNYQPFSLEAMQALTKETDKISRLDYFASQMQVIWIYLKYSAIQQSVTNPKPDQEKIKTHISAEEYVKKNQWLISLWTILGPTTQWTFLIITSFLNRIDIYVIGILLVGNILATLFYFLQSKADHALKLKS